MDKRTCAIDGCDTGGRLRRGWCNKHYSRYIDHGDPLALATEVPECQARGCSEKPRSSAAKYCSPDCRIRENHAREDDRGTRNRGHGVGACDACGAEFEHEVRGGDRGPRFCSQECYHSSRELSEDERHARYRARRSRYRAFRRGVISSGDTFDPLDIYDRDGWQCGICRQQVDDTLSYPDPRSASLDHILPISKGGKHTPSNTQCSHLECNLVKRDSVDGQDAIGRLTHSQ